MSGFSGIVIFDNKFEGKLSSFSFPQEIRGFYKKSATYNSNNFRLVNYQSTKFNADSIFDYNTESAFGLSGVRLNKENKEIGINSKSDFTEFVKTSKGSFSSFYMEFKDNTLSLATDQTGSRQIFYYINESFTAFSNSIFLLKKILHHFGVQIHIDTYASYMMLSLGYLLEDYTLIAEIKKIKAGSNVTLNAKGSSEYKYHNYFRDIQFRTISDELLIELDQRFRNSIESEYQKDREYGFDHLATLSGGLDSRLNVMLAHEYGFKDITAVTFSEGFKPDELTARKISSDLNLKHLVLLLNNGFQLYDLESPLFLNNCSVYYFGAAQTLAAVKKINFSSYGLTHNGGLAESSKGGYLSGKEHINPKLQKQYAVSDRLFSRLQGSKLENILSEYPNEEMFVTYNRGFNAIHNGSWMTLPFSPSVFTYMDLDFADLAYSIHPKLRFGGYLTVEWIKKLHPNLCKYPWQLGLRPTNNKTLQLAARVQNKIKRTITSRNDSPVPLGEWYNSNPYFRSFINTQFKESPTWQVLQKEIHSDILDLFGKGTVAEKLLCISYLKSIEMLFIKDTLSE